MNATLAMAEGGSDDAGTGELVRPLITKGR